MIKGGAKIIQLRDKSAAPRDFYADAETALKIARENGVKIIINDRVDIALALKADGIHLGQDDLPPEHARKILGEPAIIGFSTHNFEQAEKALKLPISYLAIGPVFDTKTKENPDKTFGIDNIKKLREIAGNFPLVAIGGITLENFQNVLNQGADSVAVIGDLLSDADKITEKMAEFLK